MNIFNFIIEEFTGKNFLINILIICIGLEQKNIPTFDLSMIFLLLIIFKFIIFSLRTEHFDYNPYAYNYFLPHFYSNNIKKKSLDNNYKLYFPSEKNNLKKLETISLYEPIENMDKYKSKSDENYYDKKINKNGVITQYVKDHSKIEYTSKEDEEPEYVDDETEEEILEKVENNIDDIINLKKPQKDNNKIKKIKKVKNNFKKKEQFQNINNVKLNCDCNCTPNLNQ